MLGVPYACDGHGLGHDSPAFHMRRHQDDGVFDQFAMQVDALGRRRGRSARTNRPGHDLGSHGVMKPAMQHQEIPIKVTAWVDEGIAPLVTALNDVPGVLTLDSCQESPDGQARVTFCTHDNQALPLMVERITHFLEGRGWRERAAVRMWSGCDGDTLAADLYCPPALVSALAGEIRVSADRMTPSHGDTECTAPGS